VEKGVLSAGFNLSELISFVMHCNPRDLPKDTDGNVDFPSRVSKRFGPDQLQKFRPIDDGTSNGLNYELILMLEIIAPISAEYPARVASAIYQRFSHPPDGSQQRSMPEITVATDDVDMAYKRAPVSGYEIIAYFNPHVKCIATGNMGDVVWHVSFGLPFGYVSSVSSWCRVPALMAMVARRKFACLCDSYIDDWCIVDFADAESSSQDTLHVLHTAFKLPLAACRQPYCANCNKHPLPPSVQQRANTAKCKRRRHAAFADFLGFVIDFSFVTSTGCVIIKPKTERCARILSELDDCAEALQLSPSLAKKNIR